MEPCPDPEFDSSILQPEKKKKMKELYKEHTQVVNTMTVRTNAFRLNPNASVFEPQKIWSHETAVVSSSSSGKRKLDDFIINFSNQDLVFEEDEEECQYQDFTTQRIREEDAELEQSLREIYRSTSDMLGWDCLKNCEVSTNSSFGPEWDEKILMMTAPKQVVRHFTHSTLMDGKNVVDIDYITQEMKGWTGTPPSGAVLSHSRYYYPPNMLTSMSDLPSFVPLETGSFRMTDHTKASTHHSLHHTNPHPLSSSHRTVRSPPVPVLYPFPHQFEPVVKSLEDFLPHHHSETGKRHFSSSNNMNHHHHNASTCGSSLSSSQL
jgi:hypothetical protein